MNLQNIIENKITRGISCDFLSVENESERHAVPANSQTHFKVVVVSTFFESMPLLARHRLIHKLLMEELAGPIHALALYTYTAIQWQEKNRSFPVSGVCLGGIKQSLLMKKG